MTDAIGRGPFPTTGHEAADAWIRDARGYVGIVANRCKNCHSKGHCRECLSLQARLLVKRHDDIRFTTGRSAMNMVELSDDSWEEREVIDQLKEKRRRRGDDIQITGMSGRVKADFLRDMERRGLIRSELVVTGRSSHVSRYYYINTTKNQKKPNG